MIDVIFLITSFFRILKFYYIFKFLRKLQKVKNIVLIAKNVNIKYSLKYVD